jgi:hypothetical protein
MAARVMPRPSRCSRRKLREAGVREDTLHGILVDNPRLLLAFVPKS